MKHALVVGGTGMLKDVSLWLLDQGYHVSIIARNLERMKQLMERTSMNNHITPVIVDYKNNEKLQKEIHTTIEQHGAIDLVVAWIHSDAPDALKLIAKEVATKRGEWELFHVLGSSTDLEKIKQSFMFTENCSYYQIRLGFVMEENQSRWLTNKEISDGVIAALKHKNKIRTVGQIEPWQNRP